MKLPPGASVGVGFAPYAAFFLASRAVSPGAGLWAALLAAVVIVALNRAARRPAKLLEIAATLQFAGLAGFTAITGWTWTFMTIRLAVDAGLLLIIVGSLALGQPFTLQYARERVPGTVWQSPRFISINNRITAGWAIAFLALVAAHAANVAGIGLPAWGDLVISAAVLSAAVMFSLRYPAYARQPTAQATETP